MTLVEFLRARLAEDERIAQAAIADDGGQDGGFEDATWLDDRSHPMYARIAKDAANLIRATAVPRRVLAEVAAKRRLIDAAEEYLHDSDAGMDPMAAMTLCLLALPYAKHPEYREEWRV